MLSWREALIHAAFPTAEVMSGIQGHAAPPGQSPETCVIPIGVLTFHSVILYASIQVNQSLSSDPVYSKGTSSTIDYAEALNSRPSSHIKNLTLPSVSPVLAVT
jgi:hypothetical protein